MPTARIVKIQRFCTHDGPGIRTTVFLKGCPLRCVWCQNPESRESEPELGFNRLLCVFCGNCVGVCPNHAHRIVGHDHGIDRSKCLRCFRCVEVCDAGALEIVGQKVTVEEALRQVTLDRIFYETSGGGVTLSGGEPVANLDFCIALLSGIRKAGIHTCVETCGYGAREDLLKLSRFADLFLWDVKITKDEEHLRYAGVPWQPILENLRAVDEAGAAIILRCPLVAEMNMTREHFDSIAALAAHMRNCEGVQLLPYHSFGIVKAQTIGKNGEEFRTPDRRSLRDAREYVARQIAEQAPACDDAARVAHEE